MLRNLWKLLRSTATLQLDLLDRRRWTTRKKLASAIFDYIQACHNPKRGHYSIKNLSPVA